MLRFPTVCQVLNKVSLGHRLHSIHTKSFSVFKITITTISRKETFFLLKVLYITSSLLSRSDGYM